jgi:hypothetical protein
MEKAIFAIMGYKLNGGDAILPCRIAPIDR